MTTIIFNDLDSKGNCYCLFLHLLSNEKIKF